MVLAEVGLLREESYTGALGSRWVLSFQVVWDFSEVRIGTGTKPLGQLSHKGALDSGL